MITKPRLLATVLALAALLASLSSAVAQSGKPPRDLDAIQRKVQRSATYQKQALEALSEPARAVKLLGSAYNEIKSAFDDMILNASNAKTVDAIQELNRRKAGQALTLVQQASDALITRNTDPDNAVAVARDRLQQALRVTNSLLATGF